MAGYDRIAADRFGDPEVLRLEHVAEAPEPGPGEVRVRVELAGVGYTDTILRRGRYVAYTGGLPLVPGYDAVGRVDALGPGAAGPAVGDRVAAMTVSGGYAGLLVRPADELYPVPAGVAAAQAIEVPLMGMTAWQMLTRSVTLAPGATVLVVGASGAVGRALVRLARHLGLRVIGTASAANLDAVATAGAVALDYRRSDLGAAIRAATDGAGVAAAFDAVGGASWTTSWEALAQGGTLVGYGFQDFLESGAPTEDAMAAMRLFFGRSAEGAADGTSRSTTFYDIRERRLSHPEDYRADAAALFRLIADGAVATDPVEVLPLAEAAEAHRRVAAGGLPGRLALRP